MELYQSLYLSLFNSITDALRQMAGQNYGQAKELLVSAQQRAEERYLETKAGGASTLK